VLKGDGVTVARSRDSSSDRSHRGDSTTDRIHRDGRRVRKTIYKGVTVVPGIAMGSVRLKFRQTQVLSDQTITFKEVEREYERLNEAVRLSKEQLLEARGKVQREIGELEAMIFDAHLAILEDQGFLKKIRTQVQTMLKPVEVVVSEIVEGYYRLLSMKEAEELRERAADIRDIGRRMLDWPCACPGSRARC
jgi:phosphotransferase system enzyme I (PtsI)